MHGPQPRDWSYNMPKKMRQGALRSALSERVREGKVTSLMVGRWISRRPKTLLRRSSSLGHDGKTLIVDSLDNENLMLSTRNVQSAKVVNSFALNIYDLLYHEKLIISEAAVKELEHCWAHEKRLKRRSCAKQSAAAPADGRAAKPKRARSRPLKAKPRAKQEEGGD